MAKKCIPGLLCVENMTLFLLIVVAVFVGHMYYTQHKQRSMAAASVNAIPSTQVIVVKEDGDSSLQSPPVNKAYMAPNQLPSLSTRGVGGAYTQIGILTPTASGHNKGQGHGGPTILSLMGRRCPTCRSDKMQYYTMSEGGVKLPVSRNGKSCTGEYGCDEIMNGDSVYVEGYSDTFKATVYESAQFSYSPYV